MRFRPGSAPDSAEGAYSAPQLPPPLAGLGEKREMREERERERREERRGEGR